jgi:ATP-dependent DNA helicase HFM1/MER3
MQMCGRAGRPPFDDTGMVIIMTRRETVIQYFLFSLSCMFGASLLLNFLLVDVRIVCPV